MPSEYHPQHCMCQHCRFPGEKNVLETVFISICAVVGVMAFAFAAYLLVRVLTGAGQ